MSEWLASAKEKSAVREQEKRAQVLQDHADAERAEVAGVDGGAEWMHGRDEWKRRMEKLRPKLAVNLEVLPTRKCQSQWDGNCDRSAFQGKRGAGLASEGPAPKAEWQITVDPELLKTDITGLPDGGDPKTCVSIGESMTDAWCKLNCGGSPPSCPKAMGKCEVAKDAVVTKEAIGKWGRCVGCYMMARAAHASMFQTAQ